VRHVGEERERGGVGPVPVVDEQDDGLLGGEVGGQPVQRVPDGERVLRRRGVHAREVDLQQRGGEARGSREEDRGLRVARHVVEQLAHDAEDEVVLQLGAARVEHEHPGVLGGGAGRFDERRLADARRAVDGDDRAGAAPCLRERVPNGVELAVTLEQPTGCRLRVQEILG
jgi:hypothetical protein